MMAVSHLRRPGPIYALPGDLADQSMHLHLYEVALECGKAGSGQRAVRVRAHSAGRTAEGLGDPDPGMGRPFHFYASSLSGLRTLKAAGWWSLSRAGEQVDHPLESLKSRLLFFGECHIASLGARQDVKAIFSRPTPHCT